MRIGDLKRAVEDVILRPDDNRLSDIAKRSTIAALDLCQLQQSQDGSTIGIPNDSQQGASAALTSFSCSGEMLSSPTGSTCSTSVTTSSGPHQSEQPLSMSTSLDTMVLRHSLSCRPSLGSSRRSSRVLPHYSHSKRKRSNSVSSCMNKGVLSQQGALSMIGVSSTSGGGASALSLPPTARHTPFRFGDSDDRPHTSTTEHSPIPRAPALNEASSSDGFDGDLCPPAFCRTNSDWSEMQSEYGRVTEGRCGLMNTTHSKEKRVQNEKEANGSARFSFTQFRQQTNIFDSDNDEQMECD